MAKRMLVHDVRLAGKAPFIAQNTYTVNGSTPVNHIVNWVGHYARSQSGLDELIVMCHGYASLGDSTGQMTHPEPIGASGLQLGNPGLTLRNVGRTASWKPHIKKIFLYACGVSASSRYGNPEFDGRRFCGEMALHSGAEVYAADVLQWYHRVNHSTGNNIINFGKWEGQVYRYSPDNPMGVPVTLGAQPMPT